MITDRRASNGFSSTELLLAITLVMTAAAASFPLALSYIRERWTTEAAQSVASHLQTARIEAVRRNVPNGMTLSLGYPGSQDIYLETQGRRGVRDRLQPGGRPAPGVIFRLPPGFQFESAGGPFNSLVFSSDGTVEGARTAGAVEGLIAVEGMNFVVRVSHVSSGLTRTLLVGRTGFIAIR